MKKDLLITLADRNYVEQAKQLFSSVYWNAGWRGDYMLLAYDIPERDLKWFRDKGILVRECEAILTESGKYIGHAPLTTLSKFYLFTPEFKKWKNIIFLDGDIVVRGSLDSLTQIKGFGAVRILNLRRTSLKGSFHDQNRKNKHLFKELENQCDLSRPAFNSGVMTFCTDVISEDDFQNLKDILLHFEDIIFISEETVLNIYFYGKWQELSQVYNICSSYEIYLSGRGPDNLKGIIAHTYSNFPGGKHWNPKSPLYSEWKSNLDKADMINLASPQDPKRTLSEKEEAEYDYDLKNLYRRNFYKYYRAKIALLCSIVYVSSVIFIKQKFPDLYKILKKIKDR